MVRELDDKTGRNNCNDDGILVEEMSDDETRYVRNKKKNMCRKIYASFYGKERWTYTKRLR